MKIELDKDLIKALLVQEYFYNIVYEYFFLKEAGAKIAEALSSPGGCSSCTERNIIDPSISAFMSHTVNMYLDCGPDALIRFKQYVRENKLADYITANDGGDYGVREACELLMGIRGNFNECIKMRTDYTETYKTYLSLRNKPETNYYTSIDGKITVSKGE